jgi:curved DNA-binding protein CbpA
MITKQIIFKTFGIAYLTLITSSTVFANSNNDESIFQLKSKFSKNLNSKIDRNLSYTKSGEIFGLNTFEQKTLNNYGIKVKNNLNSIIENIDVIFETNSAGLKITVERTSGRLIFLKYMDQKNVEK